MLDFALRPLSDSSWVRDPKEKPRRAPLFTNEWPAMLDALAKEIDHLKGYDVVIEVHAERSDISHRGSLARGATLWSPAVMVGFETDDKGEMVFRCDEYRQKDYGGGFDRTNVWKYNVYAVAKMLEALRAVERHGGQAVAQYEGFKALPAGQSAGKVQAMTAEKAVELLLVWAEVEVWPFLPKDQGKIVTKARRKTHPDMGGARSDWDQVEAAVAALVAAGVLPDGS